MNRNTPDHTLLFLQNISVLQHRFANAFAAADPEASRRLDLQRIEQLQADVKLVAPSCASAPGNMLMMARTAQDAVPLSPTRRRINEYFAVFTDSVEPGFLPPPPMIEALTAAQKDLLQQQVAQRLTALEALVAAEQLPIRRAQHLQEAYCNAQTIAHGADPQVRALELRLIASLLQGRNFPSALKQLQSISRRFGALLLQDDDPQPVQSALRTIAEAQASLIRLMDRAVAGADQHLGALEAASLQETLQQLQQSLTPAPAATLAAGAAARALFDFSDLRRRVAELPIESTLRKRVENQLQIFDSSPPEQQTSSGTMLENLAKLPPLRELQVIEQPAAVTSEQRNALRISLRREFAALVVGHETVRERIIESILSTIRRRGTKGWTIFLSGASGIGKNTIAKAIARALNREFVEVVCSGRTRSDEILGSLRAYVGSEPGLAADILMRQTRPAVILWDEIGKAQPEIQNTLNTILDDNANAKVRDNYFSTVDLDFSDAIHVVTYNVGEPMVGSLLRRGTQFALNDLRPADKEEIFRRISVAEIDNTFGVNSGVTVPEATRALMLERRSNEPGVGQLRSDIEAVLGQAQRVQDHEQNVDAIPPEIAMELLDGARADTRLVSEGTDLALVSDLTAEPRSALENRPDQLIWHVCAGNKQWRISVKEEGCSIQLVDGTPFLGAYGVSVLGENDAVQSLFIDEGTRRFHHNTSLNLAAARFVDGNGQVQNTALNDMRQDPAGKKLRFSVRLLSRNLSAPQVLRKLRQDLGIAAR